MEFSKFTTLVLCTYALFILEGCMSEVQPSNGDKQVDGRVESPASYKGDFKQKNWWKKATSVYQFTANNIKGQPVSFESYRGYVLLIVNVASKCGLTNLTYNQLVELDKRYKDRGLRILAFPCNQFGGQEPGTSEEIATFAQKKGVNFDMFDKIDVNGRNAHPLWMYLRAKQSGFLGDRVKWNFTKFLVNKKGQPVARFAPTTEPLAITEEIETLLKE